MIKLDFMDSRPIYEQIEAGYEDLILQGVLQENDKMPSIRALAMQLSTNPNTVQKAYAELERKGYIYTVKGRGNYVSGNGNLKDEKLNELRDELKAVLEKAEKLGISKDDLTKGII